MEYVKALIVANEHQELVLVQGFKKKKIELSDNKLSEEDKRISSKIINEFQSMSKLSSSFVKSSDKNIPNMPGILLLDGDGLFYSPATKGYLLRCHLKGKKASDNIQIQIIFSDEIKLLYNIYSVLDSSDIISKVTDSKSRSLILNGIKKNKVIFEKAVGLVKRNKSVSIAAVLLSANIATIEVIKKNNEADSDKKGILQRIRSAFK